ncbi:hypothetical protein GCM10009821_22500 [Aeromicrobium halocynthiae]|uniref:NAD-dependent epimerase/dehydratase domain-containing protein n=1 Tax=Aeromicrobium halocynthiae TaxID=560557 RepID=A0ABN2W1X5_9ACTN
MTILLAGAGGFIGGHLVADLLSAGHDVRAVDKKPESQWYQLHDAAENVVADCSDPQDAHKMSIGTEEIYNLAADMGGMGFIENNKAECMLSVLTCSWRPATPAPAASSTAARRASTPATSRPTRMSRP